MAWGRLLLQLGKQPAVRTPVGWCRSFVSSIEVGAQGARAMGSAGPASASDYSDDAVVCGRGDKKTKRGKRFKGSFGNCREQRGTTTRRLRRSWQLSYDPLLPEHQQRFPPVLA